MTGITIESKVYKPLTLYYGSVTQGKAGLKQLAHFSRLQIAKDGIARTLTLRASGKVIETVNISSDEK